MSCSRAATPAIRVARSHAMQGLREIEQAGGEAGGFFAVFDDALAALGELADLPLTHVGRSHTVRLRGAQGVEHDAFAKRPVGNLKAIDAGMAQPFGEHERAGQARFGARTADRGPGRDLFCISSAPDAHSCRVARADFAQRSEEAFQSAPASRAMTSAQQTAVPEVATRVSMCFGRWTRAIALRIRRRKASMSLARGGLPSSHVAQRREPSGRLAARPKRRLRAVIHSVLPPPMSTITELPAPRSTASRTARQINRPSSAPLSRRASRPVWARTRARNSSPFFASRTALVATATVRSAPLSRARVDILVSATSRRAWRALRAGSPDRPSALLPRRTISRSRSSTR